jgi:HEAT repeat protein
VIRGLGLVVCLLMAGPAGADEPPPPSPAVVAGLVDALADPLAATRETAASALKEYPALAVEHGAVAPLVDLALNDPVTEVREEALWVLGEIGPDARDEAIPALLDLLNPLAPPPGMVQGIAAWAVGRMDLPVEDASKALLPLLLSMDEFTQRAAADGIGAMGEPMIPMLLFTLTQMEGSHYSAGVVEALAAMGEDAKLAIPALLELQETTDRAWLRRDIDRALEHIGHVDTEAKVNRLVAELDSAPDHTRYLNIVAIGDMGPAAASAVPALLEAVADEHVCNVALDALVDVAPEDQWPAVAAAAVPVLERDDWKGSTAARALAELGEPGRDALVTALTSRARTTRVNALAGLLQIEPDPGERANKVLKGMLRDGDLEIRGSAARVYGRYGDSAFPHLQKAIGREKDDQTRSEMIYALDGMGAQTLPLLRRELVREGPWVSAAAAHQLGALGPAAAPAVGDLLVHGGGYNGKSDVAAAIEGIGSAAVPALIEAMSSDHPPVRETAVYTLGRIGPDARDAVPALALALDDDHEDVRQWAAWALGRIGPDAVGAVEDLRGALTDPETWVRANAAEALGHIGVGAAPAIPDLVAVIRWDRGWNVAANAADSLAVFGPESAEAVAPLTEALSSDRESLRSGSARALQAIGVTSPEICAGLRQALDDPKARVRKAAAEALLVLGEESDAARATMVLRRAPDEMWDEDMRAMEEIVLPPPLDWE